MTTLQQLSAAATCPNPWCASRELPDEPDKGPMLFHGLYQSMCIGCPICGLKGPIRYTEAEAWAAWNDRGQLVEVQPCPSCHGMNTSCPDGCGRDPETGELNGTRLVEVQADDATVERMQEAEDRAWEEARELVRGTNADMCKGGAGQAYRLIIERLTSAVHNRELRTFAGRVAAMKGPKL